MVTLSPSSIDANVATDVTVTVMEADGVTPKPGIDVWADGLGYASAVVTTDAAGEAIVNVLYPYGPSIEMVGQDPGETYELFRESLGVNALSLTAPDLTVTTAVGLADTFALNLPGTIVATVSEPGHTLWAIHSGGTEESTGALSLEVIPLSLVSVQAVIAVSGYDTHEELFPVVEALGMLTGTVASAGSPISGAVVECFDAGWNAVFTATSAVDGSWSAPDSLVVADYTLSTDVFGYLHYEASVFVNAGSTVHDMDLTPAPSGVLTGTITETGTGTPLAAAVKVYRSDDMSLFTQTLSDSVTGSFTTAALPYFDYVVTVKAWQHIPVTLPITISDPVVTKGFVLDPTIGELLVIDDSAKGRSFAEAKLDEKTGGVIESGFMQGATRAAADLVADLETIGYTVTTETMASTDPASWGLYDLLITSSGDNTTTLSDAAFRTALTAYAASGGHLLVEGGEVGYDYYGDASFCEPVLHMTGWNHDESGSVTVADASHYVMSVPNVITGPVTMTYANYGDQDALVPTADAVMVGSWSDYPTDASVIAYDSNPAPEGGQFVFFAFNYSAMDAASRALLLENAVTWLLTPELGSSSVSGTVSLAGQSDASGVTVTATPGGGSTTTGVDGSYTLSGLYAGAYRVVATKTGWSTEGTDVTLVDGMHMTGVDFVLTSTVTADFCDSPGLPIPDSPSPGISSPLVVGDTGSVSGVEVFVDITHTWIGDLIVTLVSPKGTSVTLHNRSGSSADDIVGWYPSVLTPDESLDALLGEDISGSWSLDISDNAGADTGTLNQWCLRLTYGSGATDAVVGRPAVTQLLGSFPNPFTSATHIAFELAGETRVHIDIHDVTGRRVATVVDELLPPGQHQPAWDGRDSQGLRTASGVYFYRFRAGEVAETKKVVLTR
ncbi:MAG: hypothetical protein CME07_05970 [Gemmatimonadetes bacterium]|nr:hypothetical protein [Gemmatimonadota bacterium]